MPAHHDIPMLLRHDFYVIYQTNLELDRLLRLYELITIPRCKHNKKFLNKQK